MPRVLVTRPAPQAREWVARLCEHGIDAAALPLIAIGPPSDVGALQAAWRALDAHALVVFVSPNAVAQFFAQRPDGCAWPPALWAGAPGPGSSAALREAGVGDAAIVAPPLTAGRFDSEALWVALHARRDWRGASVLVVRGSVGTEPEGSGREWFAQALRMAGARVEFVVAYRRCPPHLDAGQRAQWAAALAAPAQHLWLFSSSEAIDQLEALAAADGAAPRWASTCALATHPRIAERARAAGFGRVLQSAPTLAAIVAALRAADDPAR